MLVYQIQLKKYLRALEVPAETLLCG